MIIYNEILEFLLDEGISLSKADKDIGAKKIAKKKALLRKQKNCPKGTTISFEIDKETKKVTAKCTPIDKTKSMKMKLAAKKMKANPRLLKIRAKKAIATKAFRGELKNEGNL